MKKLMCFTAFAFNLAVSAQYHSIQNANDDYVVSVLPAKERVAKNLHRVKRDHKGLYWFESLNELNSFDGVTWKTHTFKSARGRSILVRINDMEITDDGTIWLATEGGLVVYEPETGKLIPVRERYSGAGGSPLVANCTFKNGNNLLFICILKEGFYYVDAKSKTLRHHIIDSASETHIPLTISPVTPDKSGFFWGITTDKKGIWQFNPATGTVKRSWKGELFPAAAKRFQSGITGITYGEKEDVLWICYGEKGVLEKLSLSTAKSIFYTFTDDLLVGSDSSANSRHKLTPVKVDKANNEWIRVNGKYLVKLHSDIRKFEYLVDHPDDLPLGEYSRYFTDRSAPTIDGDNEILLWVVGEKNLTVVRKRNELVRQVPFDTSSGTGLKASDIENANGRKNLFFKKGRDNSYFLLQQDPGRPKLVSLDHKLSVRKVLLDGRWAQLPAYFSTDFNPDTFYVAILRPGVEPLDFRNVVLQDFKIDLHNLLVKEEELSFQQRVHRYGLADKFGIYWLYSAGRLYSFDPKRSRLDSIEICGPAEKGPFNLGYVKGFDYPVVLHKESSTFWITFFPKKELYKIDLASRRVAKVFRSCFDRRECLIPSGVSDMYLFDSSRIYLQASLSGLLLNVYNDSITFNSDLFGNSLSTQRELGAGLYDDWFCVVQSDAVHFLNTKTGQRKKLSLNEDFKGLLSQFNSRPLRNDKGELILMSSVRKEFIVFDIGFQDPEKPGNVKFSEIRFNDSGLFPDARGVYPGVRVKYKDFESIYFKFSDYSVDDQYKVRYAYAMYTGGDTVWHRIDGDPELTLIRISPGRYQLLFRAENDYGGFSPEVTAFKLSIVPPFTQTIWFIVVIISVVFVVLYGLYRFRLYQQAKLQKIRNNIASDLHDDIGSTLNSISIYSEVARQQAGKHLPALDLIGDNSRKIVESMGDIVWTINPGNDSFEKMVVRMRSFAHQVLKARGIEYTFEADDQLNDLRLKMLVRKSFYLVFKEAITNLVKYSGATRVAIELKAESGSIFLRIRDNGKGILVSPETLGNGLMNMKRRAADIRAVLTIESEESLGTGVELKLKM